MKKSLAIAFFCFTGLLNCSKKESQLEVKLTPSAAYMVFGDDLSCKETKAPSSTDGPTKDIAGPRVNYVSMKIKWKKGTTLVLSDARLIFSGSAYSGGEYKCDLSLTELDCLFGGLGCSARSDGTYVKGKIIPSDATVAKCAAGSDGCETEVISDTNCGVQCGGIGVADQEKPFSATGKIVIRGYSLEADGTQIPVKAESFMTMENAP